MRPELSLIKINDNELKIKKLLEDLVVYPRVKAHEWSRITFQTPNMKIGYPGQHLASLITGIHGKRTGARGDDLEDGTEVKSCSRVDQLDRCNDCGENVLRIEIRCGFCQSTNIKRKNDSKWLFSIKTKDELTLLTETIDRVFLLISDYPNFNDGDFNTVEITAYEVWNSDPACSMFKEIMTNYYSKIFLEHIKLSPVKTPAPKNFWPYSYQFYKCAPRKTFSATITDANRAPKVNINFLFPPSEDRSKLEYEKMPTSLLNTVELRQIFSLDNIELLDKAGLKFSADCLETFITKKKEDIVKDILLLPYELYSLLSLRDTDKISVAKKVYTRR